MVNEITPRSIAVVKMRLPYTDRRSLSQAWFSALHIAEDRPPPSRCSGRRHLLPFLGRPAAAQRGVSASPSVGGTSSNGARNDAPVRRANILGSETPQQGARVERPRVAVRTSPAHVRSYPPFQSSLTVGVGGARVQLVLRRDGETLHVVALCAPRNVDLVRRALACAQAHLRARGDVLRAVVREAEVRA